MKKSKFVGKVYDNGWRVVAAYLAANYSHSTKHNYYRYELLRRTSDNKCDKIITVAGGTMTKIDKGLLSVESVAKRKFAQQIKNRETTINSVLHRF